MARKVRTTFVAVLALIISLACFFHQLFPQPPLLISVVDVLSPPFTLPPNNPPFTLPPNNPPFTLPPNNPIISQEQVQAEEKPSDANNTVVIKGGDEEEEKPITRHLISTVSVLLPAWEVVVIVSPVPMDYNTGEYTCLFPNNDASPAKPSGILPFPYRATFRCDLPVSVRRRRLPFPQPILTKSSENPPERKTPATELLRWNFLVYESFSTEKDVILFVKGLNNRQGVNRLPNEFRCVFSGGNDADNNGVRTAVTTSIQEVFRCPHPDLSALSSSDDDKPIKISLETPDRNLVVPSVAYYSSPPDKVAPDQPKSLLCACTMVYNAAKFLKEWVVYHAGIGIEKFMLYDNGSDDDLERVVGELVQQGYNVTTWFWMWPKTQEAGFSHCAVKAKDSCTWIAYIDVDEFVYSPSWINFSNPSNEMLRSLLPKKEPLHGIGTGGGVGQLMINCYEFGPSNQTSHPVSGVMQGYNCRRKEENRHKSIVLLDAIDESLLNVIHHFKLKDGYKVKRLDSRKAVVNHYKYQAWSEFKTKFRRRVSAYVVDWKVDMNLESKDRTPGLGYEAVEPQGWPQSFCEVHDNRLKNLTRRWFGVESQSGNLMHMAWQIYMKKTYRKT